MEEKIDVLVATYNGEKYIREQLDSIINQTYKNIRILISDDCSKDSTPDILKEYEQKDDRIIVYTHEKNFGNYIKNFEFLLTKVESEYYALCDQDDVWLPEKIEKTFNKLKEENADLAYTDLKVVDQDLNVIYPSMWDYLKIRKKVEYDDIRTEYLYNCVTGCTLLSKSKFIKDFLPLPCKSEYMVHDYWISLYVALHGKITHLNEATILYRQHGNNLVGTGKESTKFKKFEQVRNLFLKVKIEHFEDYCQRKEAFTKEQNDFNEKCLKYFQMLKQKKHINFRGYGIYHKLYKYDTFRYYMLQFAIMNLPGFSNFIFKIRYCILKLQGKR